MLALLTLAPIAQASCGSAFCTLMTDRDARGTGEPHLGWRADACLESVTQKQLRSGTTDLEASQVTGEEAISSAITSTNDNNGPCAVAEGAHSGALDQKPILSVNRRVRGSAGCTCLPATGAASPGN